MTIFFFLIIPAAILATTNNLKLVVISSVLFLFGLFFAYVNANMHKSKVREFMEGLF